MAETDAIHQMLLDAKSSLLSGNPDEIQWALDIPIPLIRDELADNGLAGRNARQAVFGEGSELLDEYLAVMQLAAQAEASQ